MKKTYETPSIEVVKFQYRDQVVVASNVFTECNTGWMNYNDYNTANCQKVTDSTKNH